MEMDAESSLVSCYFPPCLTRPLFSSDWISWFPYIWICNLGKQRARVARTGVARCVGERHRIGGLVDDDVGAQTASTEPESQPPARS